MGVRMVLIDPFGAGSLLSINHYFFPYWFSRERIVRGTLFRPYSSRGKIVRGTLFRPSPVAGGK